MRALNIAATGMLSQQLNVDVISNNIANLNTTGYKRQRAEFQDLIYQNLRRVGTDSSDAGTIVPTGVQVGTGVKPSAVYRIMEQGELLPTGNDLDVAIQGEGFFSVSLPDGTISYTRAGSFQLNANGEIVTSDGYTVQPGITIPTGTIDVTINSSGQVIATDSAEVKTTAGQFELSTFINPAGLSAIGGNLFLENEASGSPTTGVPGDTGFGTTLGGFLETGNVDVVKEITALITAQRAYELNSQVIQASDEMLQTIGQI
jgi:flagellar basal-body rod protein FlgG